MRSRGSTSATDLHHWEEAPPAQLVEIFCWERQLTLQLVAVGDVAKVRVAVEEGASSAETEVVS